jgi:hypothetical protein
MARQLSVLLLLLGASVPALAAPEGVASVEGANAGSAEEMIEQAKGTISFVQDGARRANKVREQADKDNDSKLSECIQGPFTNLRTLERVATQRYEALSEMVSIGDDANAARVYRSMVILRDKASTLIAQADACTADGKVQDGNSTVNSSGDALSDDDDTSPLLDDATVDIDPPPVTPFQ